MDIKETYRQLIRGKSALCLFSKRKSMESQIWTAILLKNERGLVKVEKTLSDVTDLSEIRDQFGKNYPVLLGLEGNGILHKGLTSEQLENEDILQQILPNARQGDFYLQKIERENGAWASLIRMDILEEILNQIKDLELNVVSVHLGLFHVNNLAEAIELQNNHLTIAGNKYAFANNILESVSATSDKDFIPFEQFDDKPTSPLLFAAHSTALIYFSGFNELLSEFPESVTNGFEEFKYKQMFTGGLKIALAIFMAGLLLNFFLFDHYSSKFDELSEHASYNSMQIKKLEELKEEFSRKELFYSDGNYANSTAISFYADRLAEKIPNTILLEKMAVNPVQKLTSKNKHAGYRSNIIHIKGQTGKEKSLNAWIAELQKLNWIEEVVIVDYIYKGSGKPAKFELDITVKDEFKT